MGAGAHDLEAQSVVVISHMITLNCRHMILFSLIIFTDSLESIFGLMVFIAVCATRIIEFNYSKHKCYSTEPITQYEK